MNFVENGQVFFVDEENGIFILDSYNPEIYEFKDVILDLYLTFDFGKYSVPDEFYNFNDAFQSSKYLFSRNVALIHRYFENNKYKFVEIFFQKGTGPKFYYSLKKETNEQGSMPGKEVGILSTSFRQFDAQGRLLCVVDLGVIDRLSQGFKKLVNNKEIIDQTSIAIMSLPKLRSNSLWTAIMPIVVICVSCAPRNLVHIVLPNGNIYNRSGKVSG